MASRIETFDPIAAWRHMLINGQPEQMVRLHAEIERRFLERGWSRDGALEEKLNGHPYQRNQFICWVEGAGHGPRAVLYLNKATPRRLRGGSFSLVDDPNGAGYNHVTDAVHHILAEVIEPATASVGLSIAYPRLPISRVGPRAAALMTGFAELAEGQWPLPESLARSEGRGHPRTRTGNGSAAPRGRIQSSLHLCEFQHARFCDHELHVAQPLVGSRFCSDQLALRRKPGPRRNTAAGRRLGAMNVR